TATGRPLRASSAGEAHFADAALDQFRRLEPVDGASHEDTPADESVSFLCGYPGSDFNYGHYVTDVIGEVLYHRRHQAEWLRSASWPNATTTFLIPKPKDPTLAQAVHALHEYLDVRDEDINWLSDGSFIAGRKIFCRDARIHPFCHAPWLID